MEAASLTFMGFAFVNKGACKLCRLNEQKPSVDAPKEPAAMPAEDTMETKELEDKIASLTKELEAVKAQKPTEVKVEIPKELSDQISAMAARIKELEKAPAPAVTAPVQERELGEIQTFVTFNRKDRIAKGDY